MKTLFKGIEMKIHDKTFMLSRARCVQLRINSFMLKTDCARTEYQTSCVN